MRVILAQLNPTVGDIEGNVRRVLFTASQTASQSPDLLIFPEMFVLGYPPRGMLARRWIIRRAEEGLAGLVQASSSCPGVGIIVGTAVPASCKAGKGLFNAAVLVADGKVLHTQPKSLLPTYDVSDEARYFDPARQATVVPFKGEKLGLLVCEDACSVLEMMGRPTCSRDPVAELAQAGATLLVNIAASPFSIGKDELRYRLLSAHAHRHGLPFVFVNQVGANDELVFDGRSMVLDRAGMPVVVLPAFKEAITAVDTQQSGEQGVFRPQERIESVHDALVLGIRDYASKCGFRKAVIGLSGGIDSAVTCCLAAAALGPKNVMGVTMPSGFSSAGSVDDSRRLAVHLGIGFSNIPIQAVYERYLSTLQPEFGDRAPDITEENIQARVRGNILMALSNKFGYLVLATGNKSELAVGYCTLYGDMSGGLGVLADVPKTMVYELATYVNRQREIIPLTTIAKPPSAELKPGQTDQDTLPPYDLLDGIIARYLDEGMSPDEIAAEGFEPEIVERVTEAVNRAEYKRRQAPPGIKVTSRTFGTGWLMPIAARYPGRG